jgi:hypothetical protein
MTFLLKQRLCVFFSNTVTLAMESLFSYDHPPFFIPFSFYLSAFSRLVIICFTNRTTER